MDIFFSDKGDIPVPPEKMEIRTLEAVPYSDHKRVGVRFEVSPFQKKPNIEIQIINPNDLIVANLNVVEVMDARMTFTMHMRQPTEALGKYQVSMRLYYTDLSDLENEGEDEELIPTSEFLESNTKTIQQKYFVFNLPDDVIK